MAVRLCRAHRTAVEHVPFTCVHSTGSSSLFCEHLHPIRRFRLIGICSREQRPGAFKLWLCWRRRRSRQKRGSAPHSAKRRAVRNAQPQQRRQWEAGDDSADHRGSAVSDRLPAGFHLVNTLELKRKPWFQLHARLVEPSFKLRFERFHTGFPEQPHRRAYAHKFLTRPVGGSLPLPSGHARRIKNIACSPNRLASHNERRQGAFRPASSIASHCSTA